MTVDNKVIVNDIKKYSQVTETDALYFSGHYEEISRNGANGKHNGLGTGALLNSCCIAESVAVCVL